ncbi:NrsF family protein [Pseudomonas sp. NPDC007930]|uniref:DUF1109 domain-containing protein n=1 Tax=Pseudomonas sp. NPDC007930 TaxID=3364417 RepID=UPI0036ED828F
MNTDELIALLASGSGSVDRRGQARRFALGLLCGGLAAALLMAALFGVRADLAQVAATPLFWAKAALPLSLAAIALCLVGRLGRPGVAGGAAWPCLALPLLAVWAAAALALLGVPAGERASLVLGHTWRTCPFNILLLSVPTFIGVFWALRGLAPTRPRLAGAAGGLLASAMATTVYCLHCPEMAPPFWGAWYVLGMLLPTLAGALAGPRLLRW